MLAPRGIWFPFDDPAVSGAIRNALARPPIDVLSTLLVGADRFVGALSAARGDDAAEALRNDPFGIIFPARLLQVGSGLLGRMPPPSGPSMQRRGSQNPWPAGRFER